VNRQEQIRALAIRDCRPLGQRDEFIGPARQDHLDALGLLQQLLDSQRDVENQLRFGHVFPRRARIVAAVPGVDDDPRHAEPQLTGHREAAVQVPRRRRRTFDGAPPEDRRRRVDAVAAERRRRGFRDLLARHGRGRRLRRRLVGGGVSAAAFSAAAFGTAASFAARPRQ
jgi:hypothetical protein